jgi:formamidopyrimidine-DNA glycosylase
VPELPEVEVVRQGLERFVVGRTIAAVEVRHPRAVRRHPAGDTDFAARLAGRELRAACRRGKYLWLALGGGRAADPADEALLAHLGMSGQLLVQPDDAPDEPHLRVRLRFADGGPQLRFVDQRTFGGLSVEPLVGVDGDTLPAPVAHIARDPLDAAYRLADVITALRRRHTEIKRAILDQTLVSGIGNIYADEALWRAKVHWARPTATMTRPVARAVLTAAAEVMLAALGEGGTSFDALYVNVNGQSGYFDRSLAVYGQQDRPCPRCGTPIHREAFMNRSSFSCPRCQRRPPRRT